MVVRDNNLSGYGKDCRTETRHCLAWAVLTLLVEAKLKVRADRTSSRTDLHTKVVLADWYGSQSD